MKDFNKLSYTKKCLLVGKMSAMYDENYTLQDMAEALDISMETAHDVLGMILSAKDPGKYC